MCLKAKWGTLASLIQYLKKAIPEKGVCRMRTLTNLEIQAVSGAGFTVVPGKIKIVGQPPRVKPKPGLPKPPRPDISGR